MTGCPTETEQRRFLAGDIDDEAADNMRRHIDVCRDCSDCMARLVAAHDRWIDRIRTAGVPASSEQPFRLPDIPAERHCVPGYEILDEVGRGGQGIVYRALQKSTRREVALKFLREGPGASRSARRRFEREIELAAGLRHPNIVTVHDSGVTADGRAYCIMDLVGGQRLDEYVRQRRPALEQRLQLFALICGAVNHAHQRGVIHRDLKPSNILVVEEDAAGQCRRGSNEGTSAPPSATGPECSRAAPRVLDFGLARQESDAAETRYTMTGVVAGTLPYLSPEQARGRHADVDVRSDVYALGVILYELLTDRLPYPVTGEMADVLRHITDTPPAPPGNVWRTATPASGMGDRLRLPRGLRDDLETIVLKALAKAPERRYQSAGELQRDIHHFLTGEPIEARRDSAWYVLRKTLNRHRLAAGVAAGFVVLITASAMSLAVLYGSAKRSEARAQRRFNELRQLARTFLFDFNGTLSSVAGTTPARELLARTALTYLDSLAEDIDPDDVQLQAELGAAYFQLGDVQGDPQAPNLGDREGALRNYRRGLSFVEAVARARPDEIVVQTGVGLAHSRIGNLLSVMQQAEEAQRAFDRAMDIFEQLSRKYPENPDLRRELALCRKREAGRHLDAGRMEEALSGFRAALSNSEEMVRMQPDDAGRRHDLASDHSTIGRVLLRLGRADEALESLRQASAIGEDLIRVAPNHVAYTNDCATAHDQVGQALQQLNRPDEALNEFRRSLELAESLLTTEARFAPARVAVQTALCRIGELELAGGRLDDAARTFDRHRSISESIVQDDPQSGPARRELAVSFYKTAELARARSGRAGLDTDRRLKSMRAARSALQECHAIFLRLRETGHLAAEDAGVPSEIASELEADNRQIVALERELATTQTADESGR